MRWYFEHEMKDDWDNTWLEFVHWDYKEHPDFVRQILDHKEKFQSRLNAILNKDELSQIESFQEELHEDLFRAKL